MPKPFIFQANFLYFVVPTDCKYAVLSIEHFKYYRNNLEKKKFGLLLLFERVLLSTAWPR